MAKTSLRIILLLLLSCANAQAQNALRDSLAAAVEELSYRPDSVDLRLKKARWNIELQQWSYARAEYDKILSNHPRNIAALYYRAFVLEKLRKYNAARADYESLLAIVPGHFEAKLGLALLNQKDKHHTEALDQINQLVNAHPDRVEAYAARAGIECERGMLSLAEYDYSQAIALEPENIDFIHQRLEVRLLLKDKDGARSDLQRLLQLGVPRCDVEKYLKKLKR